MTSQINIFYVIVPFNFVEPDSFRPETKIIVAHRLHHLKRPGY